MSPWSEIFKPWPNGLVTYCSPPRIQTLANINWLNIIHFYLSHTDDHLNITSDKISTSGTL